MWGSQRWSSWLCTVCPSRSVYSGPSVRAHALSPSPQAMPLHLLPASGRTEQAAEPWSLLPQTEPVPTSPGVAWSQRLSLSALGFLNGDSNNLLPRAPESMSYKWYF